METTTIPDGSSKGLDLAREKETASPARVVFRDEVNPQAAEAAEKEREDAYHAVHEWGGKVLFPFSRGREDIWHRLCAADVPLPPGFDISDNLSSWNGHAAKLLFLCSHMPHEFVALRANTAAFLSVIDQWTEEAIPRGLEIEAVNLALKIHNQAMANVAIPRPSDRKTDSGN